jgi:hypothetical protein
VAAAECEVCPLSQHLECRGGLLIWAPTAWYNIGEWKEISTDKTRFGWESNELEWNNEIFTHITEESEVHTCFNEIACLYPNGDTSKTECNEAQGYYGPLCGACDKHRNYYRNGYVCSKCLTVREDIIILSVTFIVVMVIIIYVAACHSTNRRLGENGSIIRRIAYSYVQMLGMLGIFKARGTKIFYEAIGKASETVGGGLMLALPMKCLLESQIYGSFVFQNLLPLFAFIIVAVVMIPTKIWRRMMIKRSIQKDAKLYGRFKRFAAVADGTATWEVVDFVPPRFEPRINCYKCAGGLTNTIALMVPCCRQTPSEGYIENAQRDFEGKPALAPTHRPFCDVQERTMSGCPRYALLGCCTCKGCRIPMTKEEQGAWRAERAVRMQRLDFKSNRRLVAIMVLVMYSLFPSLVRSAASIFNCVRASYLRVVPDLLSMCAHLPPSPSLSLPLPSL